MIRIRKDLAMSQIEYAALSFADEVEDISSEAAILTSAAVMQAIAEKTELELFTETALKRVLKENNKLSGPGAYIVPVKKQGKIEFFICAVFADKETDKTPLPWSGEKMKTTARWLFKRKPPLPDN